MANRYIYFMGTGEHMAKHERNRRTKAILGEQGTQELRFRRASLIKAKI